MDKDLFPGIIIPKCLVDGNYRTIRFVIRDPDNRRFNRKLNKVRKSGDKEDLIKLTFKSATIDLKVCNFKKYAKVIVTINLATKGDEKEFMARRMQRILKCEERPRLEPEEITFDYLFLKKQSDIAKLAKKIVLTGYNLKTAGKWLEIITAPDEDDAA